MDADYQAEKKKKFCLDILLRKREKGSNCKKSSYPLFF